MRTHRARSTAASWFAFATPRVDLVLPPRSGRRGRLARPRLDSGWERFPRTRPRLRKQGRDRPMRRGGFGGVRCAVAADWRWAGLDRALASGGLDVRRKPERASV